MDVHSRIATAWANGGMVGVFYKFESPGSPPPAIGAEDLCAALGRIANSRKLPREIAGCSLAWLRDGKVWRETLQSFGNAIFLALNQGGAYSMNRMSEQEAKEMTAKYMQSLFAESPESSLFLFGLDAGFSCWFYEVYWDFAYAIVNMHERWLALILATDTD